MQETLKTRISVFPCVFSYAPYGNVSSDLTVFAVGLEKIQTHREGLSHVGGL